MKTLNLASLTAAAAITGVQLVALAALFAASSQPVNAYQQREVSSLAAPLLPSVVVLAARTD